MNERDVLLNEFARGLRPMSEGIEWFDGLGREEQSEMPLFLRHHCVQARAVTEDAPAALVQAVEPVGSARRPPSRPDVRTQTSRRAQKRRNPVRSK
ncbi:DUF5958 family protein [Streptomyces sp. NPDC048669]|uniref:DUF5958 family protein n=1 Tax=Streptomyces sp. NPDC048669 TaxID=3155267 RepID=UPI003416F38F